MTVENFPLHRAFRSALQVAEYAEFTKALSRAGALFVQGEGRALVFNVDLGPGIDVAVTLERR